MNKKKLLVLTNIVLALSLILTVTAVIIYDFIDTELLREIHETSGKIFIFAVIVHI